MPESYIPSHMNTNTQIPLRTSINFHHITNSEFTIIGRLCHTVRSTNPPPPLPLCPHQISLPSVVTVGQLLATDSVYYNCLHPISPIYPDLVYSELTITFQYKSPTNPLEGPCAALFIIDAGIWTSGIPLIYSFQWPLLLNWPEMRWKRAFNI